MTYIQSQKSYVKIETDLFTFLRELKANNQREWFQANKQRYEREVRGPLLAFIAEFGEYLGEISSHYIADPKPVGGSLFRIHRDVRFSKDKSPYKTHAGIQFRHEKGKDVHAPGFYLHLEPGNVFAAAGVWHPDSSSLGKLRDAIIEKTNQWQKIFTDQKFSEVYSLAGETLKKPPRGYDPDFAHVDDLKRKDFVVVTPFSEKKICSPDFMETYAEVCRIAAPFMEFLTKAVGLDW